MKLALQGHTVLFASGDYGVGSFGGDGADNGCYKGNRHVFNPQYVSGCPWVTSVGATALYPGQTILDAESAMKVDLGPGAHKFATSGGFSNYFPRAWYQEAAVSEWFQNHDPG
jgi:tripeptidyl-peptidase I